MIDFTDKKWRFEERVTRLKNRGFTRTEAEEMVKYVITEKEGPHEQGNDPHGRGGPVADPANQRGAAGAALPPTASASAPVLPECEGSLTSRVVD